MTNLDLISAIGAAECQDLERSEQVRSGRRQTIATRILIAAAVIAMLSTTVFAVPAIRNALFGVKAKNTLISGIFVAEGKPADVRHSVVDVSLDVCMDPDAPEKLEAFYVPMLPAEQWEPIPLSVTTEEPDIFQIDDLLQWKDPEGNYVLFRQVACPDCDADYPFDSVITGFDAAYTVSEQALGGYTVQRIVVEPSQADVDGVHAEDPGLQKLYWSDGFYLFSMEVNYAMPDETLAAILSSIQPVENVYDYAVIEHKSVQVTPEPSLRLDRVLFPAALPEGFVYKIGVRQPNGEYLFLWDDETKKDELCSLELSNGPDGRNEDHRMIWETLYIPDETAELEIDGIKVIGYQNDFRAQLLWRFDDTDYTLKSCGHARLSMDELVQILKDLEIVEDIDSVLKD